MLVGVFVLGIVERRAAAERVGVALLAVSLLLGALLAAGSIDDVSATWWPGLIVGAAAAALGWAAARSLFGRVRARLDADAAKARSRSTPRAPPCSPPGSRSCSRRSR